MVNARRAALETPEVTASTAVPRRGQPSGRRARGAIRRGLAPAAIVGLLAATTSLTVVPLGADGSATVADPLTSYDQRVSNRTSREFVREPLPAALYSPTTAPSAAPSLAPSASAEASSTAPSVAPSSAPPASETTAPVEAATLQSAPEETTPAVDWSVAGAPVGSRWSTASVNVRTGPGTGFDVVRAVVEGGELTVTEATHDGWQQVSLNGGAGWVKASFLSENKPVAPTPSTAPSSAPASTAPTSSTKSSAPAQEASSAGRCAKAGSATSNMTSRTVNVLNQICAKFPSITSYGGYRAGSSGYHGTGQAIDAMISGEAGWEVARWVRANASSLGVVEVIYSQQIWTAQRSGDGWRSMSDRGSASANHYDHVHISVS